MEIYQQSFGTTQTQHYIYFDYLWMDFPKALISVLFYMYSKVVRNKSTYQSLLLDVGAFLRRRTLIQSKLIKRYVYFGLKLIHLIEISS